MLRRSKSLRLPVLALAVAASATAIAAGPSGLEDPFLNWESQPEAAGAVSPQVVQTQYESTQHAPPQREPALAEPQRFQSADSAELPTDGWGPGRNRVTMETSHPNLFPDGRPYGGPPTAYPDGTIPTQYPLDDRAYRGLPEAYPGPSMPPSNWGPPVVGAMPMSPCDGPDCPPTIGWKSARGSLTGLFGSGNSLGIATLEVRGTLESGRLPGVFVTPQFGVHFTAGPDSTDLPSQLYDATLDLSLYRPVGDAWLLNFALTPGVFTDGDNLSSDAFRLMGRAMGYYTASPTCQWALGIVYLGREDLPVLPAFGAVLTPRDDLRFELMFPKPRLAWRQFVTPVYEQWVYVTGELGGQSWAVERTSGADDIATYRDLRFVLGWERKRTTGRSLFVEGGYVFGRELEYDSNIGRLSPSDTAFLRLGGAF